MATIGVTVQLDGAASYKKQMSDITNQTKMYQAEVKKLTTEINNGNNVYQNRIARGEALEKQLASQREQEKLMLDQIEKTTEKYGENSSEVMRLKTQYENLQTAISNTEKSIKDNGDKWTALSEQIGAVGGKLTDVGDKISSVGDTMTKKLTLPILALGGAGANAASSFESAMSEVAATMGYTVDELNDSIAYAIGKRGRPTKDVANKKAEIKAIEELIKVMRKGRKGRDKTKDANGRAKNFEIKSIEDRRRRSIEGLFEINPKLNGIQQDLKGKHIVIFDDNISSGSTLDDICLELQKYGVASILPITLAIIPKTMIGPAIINIFAQTPKNTPSRLYSIAGDTTELANPVIGTKAPAPAKLTKLR